MVVGSRGRHRRCKKIIEDKRDGQTVQVSPCDPLEYDGSHNNIDDDDDCPRPGRAIIIMHVMLIKLTIK